VWNVHNTAFGSKRSAICATVEFSYNVFFKLNDLQIRCDTIRCTILTCAQKLANSQLNLPHGKWKLDFPQRDHLVMNFRRSIIIAELWRPKVARLRKNWFFLRFWEKNDPLRGNFLNSVPTEFIATAIDVLCSNFVKFGRREIGEIVRCLSDKKISPGSPALTTARITPKIWQGQPPRMYSEWFRFYPNRFPFGGVIPERVNTVK